MTINETNNKRVIVWGAVLLLVLGNVVLLGLYFLQAREIKTLQSQVQVRQVNNKVVNFLDLFIQKVLKSDTEVSFEDRLQLENAVREINDADILLTWEQFTAATTEDEIQQGVKGLLEALVRKIRY